MLIEIETHKILNALAHESRQNFDKFINDILFLYLSIYGESYGSSKFGANPAPGMVSGGGDGVSMKNAEWKVNDPS